MADRGIAVMRDSTDRLILCLVFAMVVLLVFIGLFG